MPLLGPKICVGYERNPFLEGEFLGTCRYQQNVARLLHDSPREVYGILHVTHGGNRASSLVFPVHDGGVKRRRAISREGRTST